MNWVNIVFIEALGTTLFHSIWQATLIALLMSLSLSLVNKDNAKTRYLISISSLFVLFLTSIFTFFIVYQPHTLSISLVEKENITNMYNDIVIVSNEYGFIAQVKAVIFQNIHWITLTWVLGMLFFMVKIFFGLRFTSALSVSSRRIKDHEVWELLNKLKTKAHYFAKVDLRESLKVLNPCVVGVVKPCIYFPIGLANNLSMKEAEAILAHELAHIIRNDFLINIFQSLVETLFYFHPAVWWISANVRSERENACDDLAINILGDKIQYAKSLILLQEWDVNAQSTLAMSLFSKDAPLFERMKRILNQPKNKHDMKQKIFASLILLSSIIWISATEAPNFQDNITEDTTMMYPNVTSKSQLDADNLYKNTDTIPSKVKEQKSTIVELKNGKIERLEVDGVEIPKSEFKYHDNLFGELNMDRHIFSDSSLFYYNNDLSNFHFDMEDTHAILEEMQISGDSLWSRFNSEMQHVYDFDNDWEFAFDNSMRSLDSLESDIDFARREFLYDNELPYAFHDTLRFNMDSVRASIDSLKFHFGDIAYEFRNFVDSFDFSEIQEGAFDFFDSFDLEDFGHEFRSHIDSFNFSDIDKFDFSFGNNLERAFLQELRKDDLYSEDGNEVKLSTDELEINGELQPKDMHDKYKSIYESKTGIDLLEGSSLHMKLDNKSNSKMKRI